MKILGSVLGLIAFVATVATANVAVADVVLVPREPSTVIEVGWVPTTVGIMNRTGALTVQPGEAVDLAFNIVPPHAGTSCGNPYIVRVGLAGTVLNGVTEWSWGAKQFNAWGGEIHMGPDTALRPYLQTSYNPLGEVAYGAWKIDENLFWGSTFFIPVSKNGRYSIRFTNTSGREISTKLSVKIEGIPMACFQAPFAEESPPKK